MVVAQLATHTKLVGRKTNVRSLQNALIKHFINTKF